MAEISLRADDRHEQPRAGPGSIGLYPWYVAALLSLAQLVSVLDRYLMSVALEPVKADLMLSDSQLGLLTGVSFALLFTLASLPLGRAADIGSRRLIIVCGIAAWSVATMAGGFADSFTSLFVTRLGVGLGEAAMMPAAMSLIAAYFIKSQRTKGVAIFSIGGSLGRAAAFMGGGATLALLAAHGGLALPAGLLLKPWQGLFFLAGAIGFVVALLCLTIREPRRSSTERSGRLNDSLTYFWENRGLYLRFFLAYSAVVAIVMSLASWTVSIYVRGHGLSVAQASMLVGATSLALGPAGGWFGGWLTDRMIRAGVVAAPLLVLAGVLTVAPFAGLMMALAPSAAVVALGYGIVYFSISAAGPAGFGGLQLVTPERHRGFTSAMLLCAYTLLGSGLGPLIVGLVSDYLLRDEQAIATALAASLALFALIGLPAALAGRRSYQDAMQRTD
ncbi:MAG: major facilitator superfamily 1 [Alphaproteobacteria bacterium]|nr:major facilitator superfamily 1 [Alphaproteobacteria bacterium]